MGEVSRPVRPFNYAQNHVGEGRFLLQEGVFLYQISEETLGKQYNVQKHEISVSRRAEY